MKIDRGSLFYTKDEIIDSNPKCEIRNQKILRV